MDSYEVIETVENIFDEASYRHIKYSKKIKIVHFLAIFFIIIIFFVCIYCLVKAIYDGNIYAITIYFTLIMVILTAFFLSFNQGSLFWYIMSYKKHNYNLEKMFYKEFKQKILSDDSIRVKLLDIKNILEIDTKENLNYLSTYIFSFITILVIPMLFLLFEDYAKENIPIIVITLVVIFAVSNYIYYINFKSNVKQNKKKEMLKRIERIIIENE